MKVAVSTAEGMVAEHFGRCPQYTLFTVEDGEITCEEPIDNPGHEPGFLPRYLSQRGVTCIIAGGMGPRARDLFAQRKIETVTGVAGPVRDVVTSYLKGTLRLGEDMCHHVDGRHEC